MKSVKEERVVVGDDNSFSFRVLECKYFPMPLHFHPEMEFVYINKGDGFCFVGDGVVRFEAGDLFFFGSSLSHYFRSADVYYERGSKLTSQSTYLQFAEDILPASYTTMPGCVNINSLICRGAVGLKWSRMNLSTAIAREIDSLSECEGFERLKLLYELLNDLGRSLEQSITIASDQTLGVDLAFRRVMEYVSLNFQREISLTEISDYVGMNSSALCRHFKQRMGISIFNYLLNFRINYAREQLKGSGDSISVVAYSSGFNSVSNFNVQFKKVTGVTPTGYREIL
ncbi:MAG: AraC family transcriptional regulator [Rikenellaceae bacterium]